MRTKRGQAADASGAALVILVMMIVIIIYVLMIDPEVREELLSDNGEDDTGTDDNEDEDEITLLDENPGRVDFIDKLEFEHDIPALYLRKTTNSVELKKINPFYVRSAVFDRKTREVSFFINDLENTKDVMLVFQAPKRNGILTISLNGEVVYEGEPSSFNVPPISLPNDLLREENILEFAVSDIGWQFWAANMYSLEEIRIIGDVTDISRQESQNIFYITPVEYVNLERTKMKYSPECDPVTVGRLDIYINNYGVFSGIPDCGILNIHEFPPSLLNEGTNRVIFKTDAGNYLIDLITIETKLKESPALVYYFTLNSSQYDNILRDRLDVNLTMEFVEAGNLKEVKIVVNGHETGVYTRDRVFSRMLDGYVQKNNNALKIVPKSTLNIVNLRVKLDD